MPRRIAGVAAALVALALTPVASADIADERALADQYAPIVRLVDQPEECGPGEPYEPIDVDEILGEPTVALRGPWSATDRVKIAPTAADLGRGLYEYHLDFPRRALDPKCDYEHWIDRIAGRSNSTVYAHVVSDPGHPGQLALQYWFFYVFNDYNNKHEGDWEMIQLDFDASDASGALDERPVEVGYSQHEGAERAEWGDEKLGLAGGTHPIVHPAAGSHANYYGEALYLGRSAQQGVGCDDTSSPTVDIRPTVLTIPSDPAAAREAFPWIAYEGRWGELQKAFYNGPTGPNLKHQWTEPISWAEEDWRDRSYAIPAGGLFGTTATDFFCGAVATGSDALRTVLDDPQTTLIVLGFLVALALFAITRTKWRPATPLRATRRRSWGQLLGAAARMYASQPHLFLGIALAFLPIVVVDALVQQLFFGASGIAGVPNQGETGGVLATLGFTLTVVVTVSGLAIVQAATVRALLSIDAGKPITARAAYGHALHRLPRLIGAVALAAIVVLLLSVTVAFLPLAVWLVGRWAFLAQVVEVEDRSAFGALRRSSELVRGRWFRVVSLAVVGAGIALLLGPTIGALMIFATDAPFALLNIVAGLVYVLAMPLVALTTSYVYFDAVVREHLEAERGGDVLPSELPAG